MALPLLALGGAGGAGAAGAGAGAAGAGAGAAGAGGGMGKLGGMMGKMGGGGGSGGSKAGALLGLGTGLLQSLQAFKLKKKAEAAMPDLIDPSQSSYLAELNQKRKSIETGADFQEATRAADATQATTNDAILSASGGNVSSAMQGLLQAQQGAGVTKNRALAEGQAQQINYDTAYGNMLNKIASRKMQLQMYRSQQARAEWAQKQQAAGQNLKAGVAGLIGAKGPAPVTPQTAPQAPVATQAAPQAQAAPQIPQTATPPLSPQTTESPVDPSSLQASELGKMTSGGISL